ncbi:MarR family winged helix-turn-helix transcriptional regulator [Streptomyces stelliscabiei]|uniref:MarR family winged helix-turn-helix transcriptional regulator n=1 Tax=Streptomyces stelliscabiei TaxID=146820 RepID=UPI002FF403AE
MKEDPGTADVRACETLARFSRLLETSVNRTLRREFGISWDELAVLSLLHASPYRFLHITDVAASLAFSRSRASRSVSRQELLGRLTRSRCPRDARATHVTLTDGGAALVHRSSGTYEAAVLGGLARLRVGPEQLTDLTDRLAPLTERHGRPETRGTCAGPRQPGHTPVAGSPLS